jgi:hypothetical protein
MPCSALNLVCGITVNSEQLSGSTKWDDMLKQYEIDKWNVLYHVLPNVMCRHFNPSAQSMMKVSLAAQAMSSYQPSGHIRQGQLHCEVESHVILSAMLLCVPVACFVFSFISYSVAKGICLIITLIAGKLESRRLLTVVFVKEVDSCSAVICYPDCATSFYC